MLSLRANASSRVAGRLNTRDVAVCRRPALLLPASRPRSSHVSHSMGKDVVDGWLDVAKLVAGGGGNKTPYEEFAGAIGRDIYVDIAGWHLYLRDMGTGVPGSSYKMSQALAQQLGPQLPKGVREADVEALLKKIPVKLGAGKIKASLYDVMPAMCVGDLARLCEDFARR
ncbi:hypothetical protein CHLRE_04g221250v5 [Chlamydomonas reinhardtii]|uniref:Uncharacterized protein n=1 Tax=Chlamydomonas reinhardtii TaxID=3055 RepID=A0A2K3DU99_CHLRE|nr:uncharacterized protein CHLRE_04g221250v5 [Chlamydomonas reinhardtii]PNW84109.1 hypothetical protein CHLRE_04g221250v5 [Chlamydomonas reinhardtii]